MMPPPSLVRGSKSSTQYNLADFGDPCLLNMQRLEKDAALAEGLANGTLERVYPPNLETAGRFVTLTCEDWRSIEQTPEGAPYTPLNADNALWNATLTTETLCKSVPPRQSGDRWTDKLSPRAKKKIEYSALYMHRMGRGYRTFLTLTLTKKWRAQIEKWDQSPRNAEEERKTIGRLVTEFLNVLQQRYKNSISFKQHYRRAGKQTKGGSYHANGSHFKGKITTATDSDRWTPIKPREAFRIEAHERPFDFIWVAESPENAQGEKNPHVHILLNWSVKLDQFHAWSQWIERTWGKGFAKLERIKKPAAAAHYMAKAANYISKGSNGGQGSIRGNRYNIAKEARPPKARQIGTYFADWLRDAVKLGQEAGREKWPEGLWFHKWGFGARTKAAWAQIWSVLKADGFRLKPKPAHLLNARAAEAVEQLLEDTEWLIEPMPDEYWDSLLNDNATAWAY